MTMPLRELKIGASGVRGVVGDALTPELIVNFACAFGTWCGAGPVVIGRDTRRSSIAFRAAVVSGLLSTAREVTPAEVDLMVDAAGIIALELGLRFLTDYLRGDTYFKLGPADPPDLNRTRAMVQLTLFRRFRESAGDARRFIDALRAET